MYIIFFIFFINWNVHPQKKIFLLIEMYTHRKNIANKMSDIELISQEHIVIIFQIQNCETTLWCRA